MTKMIFMSKLYKNNLYNTKKYTIDLISHIIIGENKMTKIKKENKTANHVFGQGIKSLFDKRSSLIHSQDEDQIWEKNHGT